MPKKKAQKATTEKLTWLPLELDQDEIDFSHDRTETCCGVLEIGCFSTDKNPFREVGVESKETKTVKKVRVDFDYYHFKQYGRYKEIEYEDREPIAARPATYEEILKAFKKEQDEVWSKDFGLGVAYLLPVQQNGPWGRLFKDLGWTDTGKFWNPKTRHTLHHWVKTFRKGPPGKKKSVKSILNRS
jgi:hypothetical protein